jgi:hypothetical protein
MRAVVYVEDGMLKYRSAEGTVTVLAKDVN